MSGRRRARSRVARSSRSLRRSTDAPARSARAASTRRRGSAPSPGCERAWRSSAWPARSGREGAQLVAQGEGGLRALLGRGFEEGPGVAPRERTDGSRHGRAFRARRTASHAMLGRALCLTSMVPAGGLPGGARGASAKARQDTTAATSGVKEEGAARPVRRRTRAGPSPVGMRPRTPSGLVYKEPVWGVGRPPGGRPCGSLPGRTPRPR